VTTQTRGVGHEELNRGITLSSQVTPALAKRMVKYPLRRRLDRRRADDESRARRRARSACVALANVGTNATTSAATSATANLFTATSL